ncbi:MAG: hypothetical protein H0T46_24140 [Deltaproteobacteria bacterium]|nr:hypothetical protein [Deltaproteobacteria bacterium]
MRLVLVLLLTVSACRPPGHGRGGGDDGGDDPKPDAAVVSPDGTTDGAPATCTKAFRLEGHGLANSVALTGSFVSWAGTAPPAVAFTKGGDGAWTGSHDFVAGMHQYKYIVDGSWIPDPTNPNQIDDGFGGKNSVISCTP